MSLPVGKKQINTHRSVSYTHLDVYKRQFLAFIADVVLASPSSPVGIHRRRVWKHKLIFVHGLISVSYTHLSRPSAMRLTTEP